MQSEFKGRSLAIGVDLVQFVSGTNYNFLEIGCYDGYNLKQLAEIYEDKVFYGIDPFISDGHVGSALGTPLEKQKENLYFNIDGKKNILFTEATSEEFLHKNNDYESMNVSFVFIDGAHIYEAILADIDVALACIKNNKDKTGSILFHDLHIPDVRRAIEHLKAICLENNVSCTVAGATGCLEIKYA